MAVWHSWRNLLKIAVEANEDNIQFLCDHRDKWIDGAWWNIVTYPLNVMLEAFEHHGNRIRDVFIQHEMHALL